MLTPQFLLPLAAKLVIDLFAGGGGASTGIEQAIGRPVDVAISLIYTAISIARQYVLRRWFNARLQRAAARMAEAVSS